MTREGEPAESIAERLAYQLLTLPGEVRVDTFHQLSMLARRRAIRFDAGHCIAEVRRLTRALKAGVRATQREAVP